MTDPIDPTALEAAMTAMVRDDPIIMGCFTGQELAETATACITAYRDERRKQGWIETLFERRARIPFVVDPATDEPPACESGNPPSETPDHIALTHEPPASRRMAVWVGERVMATRAADDFDAIRARMGGNGAASDIRQGCETCAGDGWIKCPRCTRGHYQPCPTCENPKRLPMP
jgi:hypothetical protein